jgi:regulator of cell morphogenesis and NO signaling
MLLPRATRGVEETINDSGSRPREPAPMNPAATLADLAVTHPGAARVFYRNRLDFCCGGRRPLAEVCEEQGLDVTSILNAIEVEDPLVADAPRWDEHPLPELVRHIVTTYHARLRQSLPELRALAEQVEQRHADKATCPKGLADHLAEVHAAVTDHLEKEEQILFPMILDGMGHRAAAPVHVMELEHEHHKENLQVLRRLTSDLTPPEEACTTWRALYLGIQQLEQELMEHIHLENNVLFRRALTE